MKAMLFYGPQDLRYEDVELGALEDAEVLVKIDWALTGGSDLKTYLRGHPKLIKSTPSLFGYEYAGRVAESRVPEFSVGDPVISANTAPCYQCFFCHKEEYTLCESLEFLNGSFAEYIKIPASIVKHNLLKIPQGLDPREAAATQTLAVALHGLEKSQIQEGDVVAILGLGAIGQSFIKLCKNYLSNIKIVALGRSPQKLELAKANGADHVLDISPCFDEALNANKLKKLWEASFYKEAPYGADKVIEAVGKVDSWEAALALARPGGLVNMFGGCPPGTKISLDTYKLHYEELRIVGAFHHSPKHIRKALKLIASKQISMANLISHEFPLQDLEQALLLQLEGAAMKVGIDIGSCA